MFGALRGYTIVRQDEEKECGSGAGTNSPPGGLRCLNCHKCSRQAFRSRIAAGLGWILSLGLAIALFSADGGSEGVDSKWCLKQTTSYSPILESLDPGALEFRFNGSIRWPSPYRGPPSPEVDAAWNRISIVRPLDLPVSRDDFFTIGTDPDTAATNAPESGGGYFMVPEFTHQLHCVNLLRKASYFKFEYYDRFDPDFVDDHETFKVHLDHCIEMIRQFVMCHADVGIVTAHWIQQRGAPWPDFNTKHVCRDFEKVLDWTHRHQLPEGTALIPSKPEGAMALSSPP